MGKLLAEIKAKYNSMSKSEKKIANYIFDNINDLKPMSITDFSKTVSTSEATIVRFVKTIGCSGYPQFKIMIAKEENTHHIINESIKADDDILTMYSKMSDDVYNSLIKTKNGLSNDILQTAFEMIVDAKEIMLFGVGNSYVMCLDFYHKLLRLGLNVHIAHDSHFALIHASKANKDTLIISISHSGYTKDVFDATSLGKEKGARVITITSDPKSPIASSADLIIPTNSEELDYRILGLSSRYSELLFFDTIYSYGVLHLQNSKNNIEEIEKRIFIKRLK
jgi:DNA-binding MurR/RpiR family transcriptional regulator